MEGNSAQKCKPFKSIPWIPHFELFERLEPELTNTDDSTVSVVLFAVKATSDEF
jgi:hypothetical protein